MTKAVIFKHDGKVVGFSINGHTEFAQKGYDIYCAGISSLSQAAYMCIESYLKRDIIGDEADGKLNLKLKTPPDVQTEAVFQTMLIGLTEIEKLVPNFFKIVFREV